MARILIIEDNEINLELIESLLQGLGHETITARDGDEGIAKARSLTPDLILCDVEMPGCDGYVVAAELKSNPASACVPLVAVTAHAMVGDRDSALSVGFDAHFPKPIDPPVFARAIESMLAAHHRPSPPAPPDVQAAVVGVVPDELCAPRSGLTLLIVDDSPSNLHYKSQLFEAARYCALQVNSVREAQAMLAATDVDLVVCDVVMPQANGFDLLTEVRRNPRTRDLPVVLLTASPHSNILRKQGLALGAQRFLARPIEAADLLREVRSVLEGGSSRR
jgi:CheY-like chemotaxis protein